ncbi:TPA: GNAT family N-acetyltransferase [Streptococcus suis]|uniref:GNAT family N-acetyltransferase n=1 Tax=Streptococcus suis TaxID=1307 RepID=UPI002AAC99D3|nr:GNAT family N-acetyltransferase [Streptococcus suis]
MTKKIAKWEKDGFVLQSFQAGFAEKYYEDCFTKPSAEIDRLTGSSGTYRKEDVVSYYNRIVNDSERFDFMLMAPDGTFIGESVINELDRENSSANFRIVIFDEGYLGQGLGSWAVEKTRDFAFEQVGLHRLELEVFSFNPRAKRAYEKAGFRLEGIKRDSQKTADGYTDTLIMSILEEEWKALKKPAD